LAQSLPVARPITIYPRDLALASANDVVGPWDVHRRLRDVCGENDAALASAQAYRFVALCLSAGGVDEGNVNPGRAVELTLHLHGFVCAGNKNQHHVAVGMDWEGVVDVVNSLRSPAGSLCTADSAGTEMHLHSCIVPLPTHANNPQCARPTLRGVRGGAS